MSPSSPRQMHDGILSLAGKTALISGAAGNIGSGTARLFADHGADLVLTDRHTEGLDRLAHGIRQRSERKVVTIPADLSSKAEVDRVAVAALDAFERVDILMNNAAGAMDPEPCSLLDSDDQLWDEGISVNV